MLSPTIQYFSSDNNSPKKGGDNSGGDSDESKKKQSPKKDVSMAHFFTGAVAGAVSRSATCPLERLKILRQTSVQAYSNLSLGQAMMQIYRTEGIIGLYKGNGVNVFRASPCAALEFL